MKLALSILCVFFFSCAITNHKESNSLYDLMIKDIKQSKEFLEFKKNVNEDCNTFKIAKNEYHLCELNVHFKNSEINILKKKCKDLDFATLETGRNDLDKYSDEGEPCFILYFSEKNQNKIAVELIQRSAKDRLGYENLNFLYRIKSDSEVERLEVGGMIIN